LVVSTVAGNVDLVVHLASDGAGRRWFRLREWLRVTSA
jgi:hypothetical protein